MESVVAIPVRKEKYNVRDPEKEDIKTAGVFLQKQMTYFELKLCRVISGRFSFLGNNVKEVYIVFIYDNVSQHWQL